MPLRAWPSEVIHEQNHASWELDPAAQAALGPTIARWLAGGWAEFIDLLAGHIADFDFEQASVCLKQMQTSVEKPS